MARTKAEVVQRTFERMGVARPGGAVDGNNSKMATDALSDLLLALNEDRPLDFDPTADSIPEERVYWLVILLANTIGPTFGQPRSFEEMRHARVGLFDAIQGSDHVSATVENF